MEVEEPAAEISTIIPDLSESAPLRVTEVEKTLAAAISSLSEDELADTTFVSAGYTLGDTSVGDTDDFDFIGNAKDDDDGDDTFGSLTLFEGIILVSSLSLAFIIAVVIGIACCCCGCCGCCGTKHKAPTQLSQEQIAQWGESYPQMQQMMPGNVSISPHQQWGPYDPTATHAAMIQPGASAYYDPHANTGYTSELAFQQEYAGAAYDGQESHLYDANGLSVLFDNEHAFLGREYSNALHNEPDDQIGVDEYINAGSIDPRYTGQNMM
jgi:hypothetical protein